MKNQEYYYCVTTINHLVNGKGVLRDLPFLAKRFPTQEAAEAFGKSFFEPAGTVLAWCVEKGVEKIQAE